MPGAEKGSGAPGGRKKRLRGAEKGQSAPGRREKQLPGRERVLVVAGSYLMVTRVASMGPIV